MCTEDDSTKASKGGPAQEPAKTMVAMRLANGKFLKSYQYSQGYLDHEETDVPWLSEDLSTTANREFARKLFPGATVVLVRVSCEITEYDRD